MGLFLFGVVLYFMRTEQVSLQGLVQFVKHFHLLKSEGFVEQVQICLENVLSAKLGFLI